MTGPAGGVGRGDGGEGGESEDLMQDGSWTRMGNGWIAKGGSDVQDSASADT